MIEIRPHRISDIPYRVIWLNNPNVNQYIGQCLDQKTTFAKQKVWFNKYLKDKNKKFFTMSYGKIPIGFMGLSRIDKTNRNADVFIAIGDDKYRGKGFGEIAMQYLIKFGFKKLGFVIEGTLKDDVFFAGEYHNQILMAIFNKKVAIKTKK